MQLKSLVALLLMFIILCLPGNSLGQEQEDRRNEQIRYLKEYYQDKRPEDIWSDYVNMTSPDLWMVCELQEPFRSWALAEALKKVPEYSSETLIARSLANSECPRDIRDKILRYFLNDVIYSPIASPSGPLNAVISAIDSFNFLCERECDRTYGEALAAFALKDSSLNNLRIDELVVVFDAGTLRQKSEIAKIILMRPEPELYALFRIAKAGIPDYSDIVENMIPILEEKNEVELQLSMRRSFLEMKMKMKP